MITYAIKNDKIILNKNGVYFALTETEIIELEGVIEEIKDEKHRVSGHCINEETNMNSFLTRIKDSINDPVKRRASRNACIVPLNDLRELIYHFEDLDNTARERHDADDQLRQELKKANDRVLKLEETLSDLVNLKDYKDEHGKTERYLKHQPQIWIKAKTVLKGE